MVKNQEELTRLKKEYEALTNKLNELNEDKLSSVCAGKSIVSIVEELFPLASNYPDVILMMDALDKGDYGLFLTKILQEFSCPL